MTEKQIKKQKKKLRNQHRKELIKYLYSGLISEKQKKRLYNTAFWKRKARYQREKQPLCEVCLKQTPPIFTKATSTDHIKPFMNEREFYQGNVQSICDFHHREKNQLYDHPATAQARKTALKFF